jgi:uncharacterized OB-fold protein
MSPTRDMAAYATVGRLALQRCTACGSTQYPPRELCAACLAERLEWHVADAEGGQVLANTVLHHSHEPAFRNALPLNIGLVHLDTGPIVVCFLTAGCDAGTRVQITARSDIAGRAVLTARPGP